MRDHKADIETLKAAYPNVKHAAMLGEILSEDTWSLLRKIGRVEAARKHMRRIGEAYLSEQPTNAGDMPLCLAELDHPDFDAYLRAKMGMV